MYWKPTTKEVYNEIFKYHKADLAPYGSFTDSTGEDPLGYGKPYMDTEWGFRDANIPLIRCEQIKQRVEDKDWQCSYYIYSVTVEQQP